MVIIDFVCDVRVKKLNRSLSQLRFFFGGSWYKIHVEKTPRMSTEATFFDSSPPPKPHHHTSSTKHTTLLSPLNISLPDHKHSH